MRSPHWCGALSVLHVENSRWGRLAPDEAATFLLATYEGYISLAKSLQDVAGLQAGEKTMISYLESLRGLAAE
jgi:hypothetical protein